MKGRQGGSSIQPWGLFRRYIAARSRTCGSIEAVHDWPRRLSVCSSVLLRVNISVTCGGEIARPLDDDDVVLLPDTAGLSESVGGFSLPTTLSRATESRFDAAGSDVHPRRVQQLFWTQSLTRRRWAAPLYLSNNDCCFFDKTTDVSNPLGGCVSAVAERIGGCFCLRLLAPECAEGVEQSHSTLW